MEIGHKYNSRKVLGFIATGGGGRTKPGNPYLSCFPDIYSNISFRPDVHPILLYMYFNDYNSIYNQNRMQQSGLLLEKYWVTQSV